MLLSLASACVAMIASLIQGLSAKCRCLDSSSQAGWTALAILCVLTLLPLFLYPLPRWSKSMMHTKERYLGALVQKYSDYCLCLPWSSGLGSRAFNHTK